jgi:hypothetical protein
MKANLEALDPSQEMLSLGDIARVLGISKRSAVRLRTEHKLPPPDAAWSKRMLRWSKQAILRWILLQCPSEAAWRQLRGWAK